MKHKKQEESKILNEDSQALEIVRKNLDSDYYLEKYSDVRASGIDPAEHYLRYGWHEGRDPSPDFQTDYYLKENPDIASTDICPLIHYVMGGREAGRSGSPREKYQAKRYLQTSKHVKKILQFIDTFRGEKDYFDHEAFDSIVLHMFSPDFYRSEKGLSESLSYTELLKEYLLFDFPNGIAPGPFFDAKYYSQEANRLGLPPIKSEKSPFRHWLIHGVHHRVVPTPHYSDKDYLGLNKDLEAYPDWLFFHFIEHGANEGRRFNNLFFFSGNTIEANSSGISSRTSEFLEYVSSSERMVQAKASVNNMSKFLASDLAKDIVAAASELEPGIGALEDYSVSLVPPWHDTAYCEYKTVRGMLPDVEYENIILVPFCKLGGADYVAGVLSHALVNKGIGKTLILRTEQSEWARPDWFAEGVDSLDISQELNVLVEDTAIRILYELIRETGAKNVFNVNSRRGFQLFERFGQQLATISHLHAYYFCADRTKSGVEVGYPVWYFSNILESLSTALIDNQALENTLCARYNLTEEIAEKVQTIYTPAMISPPAQAVVVRQVETQKKRRQPVILWAGRLDRQKRFDLVIDIAKAMPDVKFRCWGKAVLDAPPNHDDLPDNMQMEGAFESFDELPFRDSDGWLYTSEWDGLPTILIECAALGVPIVASSVGGVPELINEKTGWPVDDAHDSAAYVSALKEMLGDSEERLKRAQSLQQLASDRHTFDAYKQKINTLIERCKHA